MTVGTKGRRATVGLPGTGLSYTAYTPNAVRTEPALVAADGGRPFSWLGLIAGIFRLAWMLVAIVFKIGLAVLVAGLVVANILLRTLTRSSR
jgi:hypothetical protein